MQIIIFSVVPMRNEESSVERCTPDVSIVQQVTTVVVCTPYRFQECDIDTSPSVQTPNTVVILRRVQTATALNLLYTVLCAEYK